MATIDSRKQPVAPGRSRLGRRAICAGALASLLPRNAYADEAAPAAPAEGLAPKREAETRNRSVAENYTLSVEGTDLVVAGATIGVNAPLADVKRVLLAFHRYKDILPRLQQSRVVAETDGETDVYMRAPIMNGLAAIWGVVRFRPLVPWRKRGFQLAGARISGNVDKWTGKWMAFPCGDKRTLLKLELFCDVGLPIPTRVVTKWLLWACSKSVTAVRDMAECGSSSVAKD